jgi:maleate cis-trans isomerase
MVTVGLLCLTAGGAEVVSMGSQGIIEELEAAISKPVLTANQVTV